MTCHMTHQNMSYASYDMSQSFYDRHLYIPIHNTQLHLAERQDTLVGGLPDSFSSRTRLKTTGQLWGRGK